MCKWNKYGDTRIDHCMREFMKALNMIIDEDLFEVVACCCGHGRYPMTVVIKNHRLFSFETFELISSKHILRKKRFYKRDSKGYYFIPEVSKEKK